MTLVGTGRATFLSNSADGAHVFFHSRANLVAEDQDNCGSPGVTTPCEDFYERTGGETRLISTGPSANGSIHNPYGNGFAASRDGEHAVFATLEQLVPEDTDTSYDIYDRAAGQTRLVSTGPSSTGAASVPLLGTDRYTISEDGTRVVFITNEQLVPEDQDALHDVYLRAGDTTTLVSTGPKDDGAVRGVFPQMTPSGDRVFFQASGHLTARDTDSLPDLYEWSGGKRSWSRSGRREATATVSTRNSRSSVTPAYPASHATARASSSSRRNRSWRGTPTRSSTSTYAPGAGR